MEMPEPVAPTTAMVEGMCCEQLQNSSRFKESILFWATKLRVASKALETVLQVSNIRYPSVMLGRRAGLLFISSMANIMACNQRNPRKLYLQKRRNGIQWKLELVLLLFGFMTLGSLRLEVLSVNGDSTDLIGWLGTGDNYAQLPAWCLRELGNSKNEDCFSNRINNLHLTHPAKNLRFLGTIKIEKEKGLGKIKIG